MATQITSYTTNEEVQTINEYYENGDGSINYDGIAAAIQTGDSSVFNIEDLITAYMQGTGQLPDYMMSPEGGMGSPEDYPWLWTEEVTGNLQQLGDLYGNNDGTYDESDYAAIRNFLTWGSTAALTASAETGSEASVEDDSVISQIEEYLNTTGLDEETSSSTAESVYDLFNANDLSEVMSLFVSMGNPGIALLMYTAYALAPQMQSLQETALDVIEDSSDQMEDLMDQLEDLDPESTTAQYDSQAISQQLSVVSTVLSTMTQFIKDAQDVLDQMIELASNLSESANQATDTPIRNIG